MTDAKPWCCTGRVSSCPLCPQYGSSYIDPCPGHDRTPDNEQTVTIADLHARKAHPDWEYATTEGPRKQWDDASEPPSDDDGVPDPTWERNLDAGYRGEGWERFDYTEESYWRRRRSTVADQPDIEIGDPHAAGEAHGCPEQCPAHNPGGPDVDPYTVAGVPTELAHLPAEVRALILTATRVHQELDGLLDAAWNTAPEQQPADGYCPHCGRGDAGPSPEAYEELRQRAEQAEAATERVRAFLDQDQDGLCCSHTHGRIRTALEPPKEQS
ncbi:hypothetical protein [Streptomyces sp. NPDC059538]|uniref:hypothetical protein n=1 Tax=Streptomyces sp. NPDC059538 TaxID=3346860 RepID=UPI0036BC6962